MCGIAGLWTEARRGDDEQRMKSALDKIRTRGPDGEGLQAFGAREGMLFLGHRRLSIIDLTDAGLQPMYSADGHLVMVFNGEIYNYIELREELRACGRTFLTATDTEVLLQAWQEWGEDCLERLDGMYAFVVYDRKAQTLTAVRDAFGIKPLFYSAANGRFAFASEIRALLELDILPPRMNRARAYNYLCWGDYDDDETTFYDGIQQLRPGELLVVDLRGSPERNFDARRWWNPLIDEREDICFEDAVDEVRHLFLQSVRRQLRADVPLGVNLSGGVDSSAVTCAVRHLEPKFPIQTFSYAAGSETLNERRWAQLVIDHVGAEAHWTDDTSGDMFVELDDIIAAQGEPFGSTSIAASYRVFRLAQENGVTVTLDGQGADELLAGYSGYPTAAFQSRFESGGIPELLRFVSAWKKNWPGRSWRWAAMHLGDALLPSRMRDAAFAVAGHTPKPPWVNVRRLRDAGVEPRSVLPLPQTYEGRGRRLAERLRTAQRSNRLPALLRHGDRNSMRWSIESRVPFCSPKLAKFLLTLPENFLLSRGAETKHVFRAAMRGIVPDAILDRPDKIGFETPEKEVLNRNRPQVDQWLEAAREIDFLNHGALKAQVDAILDGRDRFSFKAWRMINYCRWVALHPAGIA